MTTAQLDPEAMRMGATIRALCDAHGLRVGQLAAATSRSHSYVSNVMAGRKKATPHFCRQVADLLNIPLAAITISDYAQIAKR